MCAQAPKRGGGSDGAGPSERKKSKKAVDRVDSLTLPTWQLPCRVSVRFSDGVWYDGVLSNPKGKSWRVVFDNGDPDQTYTNKQISDEMKEGNFKWRGRA